MLSSYSLSSPSSFDSVIIKKKNSKNPQTWNWNGNSPWRCLLLLLLRNKWRKQRGIFEEAKGLLMNRAFIDLWTKQLLIMCEWAINWGSETRSLPARVMHGQDWGGFDWVLRHWGKGWDENNRSPDPPRDLPFRPFSSCFCFPCFFSPY